MKKEYSSAADALLRAMGGKGNIVQLSHCLTRLRFYLRDRGCVNETAVNAVPEVSGTTWYGDQFQVIVGSEVDALCRALFAAGVPGDDAVRPSARKRNPFSMVVDAITGCMTPLIPALTAAGMIKVVLALLAIFHLAEPSNSTYQVLHFIGDAAFYFMPFLIAANAAKVFKVNQALALIIAGVFLHPDFVSMIAGNSPISFIGLPVTKTSYAYSVIPVILMVWLMSYVEKFVDRITPHITKLILGPTLVTLISAPIALIVVGPLGAIIGSELAVAITFLSDKIGFLIVGILAAAFPLIVMTGMHHALTPVGLNEIATDGSDGLIYVAQTCSNVAQGGAALAVALKSKNRDLKQLAGASGLSALMGITEPAMYGVTLKLRHPMTAAAIAAGIGGIVGGILQVSLYIPQASILSIPSFIGEHDMTNLLYGTIMIGVSFAASFILTLVFGFEDPVTVTEAEAVPLCQPAETPPVNTTAAVQNKILSPMAGRIVALENVPSKVFSERLAGDGVAILPTDGRVFAPANGTVLALLDTRHGIGLVTESGVELLIHIGLETLNLKGQYFTAHVQMGDKVKQGDLLIEFDKSAIEGAGYNLVTPVVVTNIRHYREVVPLLRENDEVTVGAPLMTVM